MNHKSLFGLLKNKICKHLFCVACIYMFRNEHQWNLIYFVAYHVIELEVNKIRQSFYVGRYAQQKFA